MSNFNLAGIVSALNNGQIIVYPTDTLYGLGADIYNDDAVKKIFLIKKRSFDQPLSVAVSNINDIEEIAFVDDKIRCVAERFLPGKLTLVLKKKNVVSDILTAGSTNVAVRIPDNSVALRILSVFGPLICTSANIHGMPTPNKINEIQMQFKDEINIYIDAGELKDKPSTIIDLSDEKPKVLREGAIPAEEIIKAIL
jgi:L-threonylcarbamoyladenylate synthase